MRFAAAFLLIATLVFPVAAGEEQTVKGRVVDEKGKVVAGARVHVGQYWPGGVADTDKEGRFTVSVAPGMRAPISVFANGFRTRRVEAEPGTKDLRIVLDPGVTIRGQLTVPEGQRLPKRLEIVSSHYKSRTMTGPVDDDGTFALRGFEPSKEDVRVFMRAEGFSVHIATYPLDVTRAAIDMKHVRLDKARALSVQVQDHRGKALPRATVVVGVAAAPGFTWRAESDADGRVRFPATSNNRLELQGTLPDGRVHWTRWVIDAGTEAATQTIQLWPHILLTGRLEWTGGGDAPWSKSTDAVTVLTTVYQEGKQVTSWFGRTDPGGKPRFVLEKGHPGRFELAFSISLEQWWRSERVTVEIPASALDTGRYDIGVVKIAAKKPR